MKPPLRICILMEDGYLKYDAGYYLRDHSWTKVVFTDFLTVSSARHRYVSGKEL